MLKDKMSKHSKLQVDVRTVFQFMQEVAEKSLNHNTLTECFSCQQGKSNRNKRYNMHCSEHVI